MKYGPDRWLIASTAESIARVRVSESIMLGSLIAHQAGLSAYVPYECGTDAPARGVVLRNLGFPWVQAVIRNATICGCYLNDPIFLI